MRKAILLVLVPAAFVVAQPAQAAGPLQTAVYVQDGDIPGDNASANVFFKRIKQTGATAVRLTVTWRDIAPATRPSEFHPKDPADTAYKWTYPDRAISLATANGLTPLVDILGSPAWAGGKKVSVPALGEFATAVTSRYNGTFEGLPRVKFWMVWNEPNLSLYLAPQVSGKKLVGAARYRSMVNAFASAAHAVRRDNMVVAGLVAPFTFRKDPGPLTFMKAVLSGRTEFDIWAVHPYTSGGPRHHAVKSTDVSLGDLPKSTERPECRRPRAARRLDASGAALGHRVQLGLEAPRLARAFLSGWRRNGSRRRSSAPGRPGSACSPGSCSRTNR